MKLPYPMLDFPQTFVVLCVESLIFCVVVIFLSS